MTTVEIYKYDCYIYKFNNKEDGSQKPINLTRIIIISWKYEYTPEVFVTKR